MTLRPGPNGTDVVAQNSRLHASLARRGVNRDSDTGCGLLSMLHFFASWWKRTPDWNLTAEIRHVSTCFQKDEVFVDQAGVRS